MSKNLCTMRPDGGLVKARISLIGEPTILAPPNGSSPQSFSILE